MAGLLFVLLAVIVISNFQYQKKQSLIDENIDLREKIAKELNRRFTENNITSVTVDMKTGDIEFVDSDDLVWFKYNKAKILPKARAVLDRVMPIYLDVLFDNQLTGEKLDRILVEGHASEELNVAERYLSDLKLSEARAFSVGAYIIRNNIELYEKLKSHMVTLGRSFADSNYKGIDNQHNWKDRKVKIRFTLQYEQMMKDLSK